ncbi:MAG: DUF5916 domain-containing protein [Bacteroidota bacterium]
MTRLAFLLSLMSCCTFLHAQEAVQRKAINILQTEEVIQVDGILNESTWEKAEIATDFVLNQPIDGKAADKKTEVRIIHNDRYVYIAAKMWDDPNYIIQTLKRDNVFENDEFGVLIDPVGQQANGFIFSCSAYGVQTEALVSASGTGLQATNFDMSWDNRWFSAVDRQADHWTVEMAIPFKTLRYKENIREWGINFIRLEPGSNETHVWSPVPRQFDFFDLGYTASLLWESAPAKQGSNISFIPYITSRMEQSPGETDFSLDAGIDAKVGITPTLNLDLTVNPDFSQVEVDRQVTNLTRFNIFFPERRQFFLENADIFNEFGQFAERPFYSRRIGLDESGQTVPIQYGVRLSGNLNNRLRIGAFNMHTQGKYEGFQQRNAQNYSALTFQQRIWQRSSIKGIFLNRQSFNNGEMLDQDYGRNLGGEFNYIAPDGKWTALGGYLHSFKEGFDDKNKHIYGRFSYNGTNFRTFLTVQDMGENYFADMGFTGRLFNFDPRTGNLFRIGFTQVANMMDYYIYPKNSKKVNFHWSGLENFVWFNEGTGLNEWYTRLRHFIFFKNTSQLRFRLNNNYIDLVFPFALTDTPLPVGDYNMTEFNVQFNTDVRKLLTTQWFIVYGEFYNGNKLTYRGNVSYRVQPWGTFTLGLEQNHIRLPQPYGNLDLTLATGRFEVNFANNLFWTTFLQYNTQANNFNINSRFQWRFAPMSDVFLVYTDNYAVEGIFGPKNRSLVLKMNYWLTL